MNITVKQTILLVLLAILFTLFGYFIPKNESPKNASELPRESTKQQSYLGSGIQFKNFLVHFDKVQVLVTSFEGQPNWPGGYIKQADYPELFKAEGGGIYFLTAKEINDKVHNKQFVFISKEVFSHGAYVVVYGLIFDPSEGKVVYETPEELAMSSLASVQFINGDSVVRIESYPYYFYASCTSCKLGSLDFASYDPKQSKFVSANNKFKQDFEKLLVDYNSVATDECSYNGKITSVKEIEKIAGRDAKCDNLSIPSEPRKAPDYYITIGQFQDLRDKISGVISGEIETLTSSK